LRIVAVKTRNVCFSEAPSTLRRHLVSNASTFEDFEHKKGGWFGPAVCTLVEVESDDGTIGIGTAGGFHGGAKGLIDMYYRDLVLDQDPRRHEHLWQRMYRTTVRFGRSGAAMSAISGIDIACWDLHAKHEGKPVYDLIGGRTQTRVPCYASRLKQRFGFGPRHGPEGMRRNVELVKAVREVVGDSIELAADAYMGWDIGYAIEIANRLRDYSLSWIEEPLMPHDVVGYQELVRRCPWQRWSGGEHSSGKWEFKDLIERRALDILQPDVNRAGGITEVLKICALAEAAGLPVIPHSNEAHNLHVIFSQSAHVCPLVEYFPDMEPDTGNELFWKVFHGNSQASDGSVELSNAPGLGISIYEQALKEIHCE
jgi:L-rhamnonate dehydratase